MVVQVVMVVLVLLVVLLLLVVVVVVLVVGPGARMYAWLSVCWGRSGVPALRCTICCRCVGVEVGSRC